MSGVIIRPADRADDAAILTLVRRTPQPGRMVLNFEREPAFFDGAEVTCEQPDVWVAQLPDGDEDVIAVFNIGYRRVFVNGEPRSIRYAHDLRIDPAWRGSLLLVRMFRKLRGANGDGTHLRDERFVAAGCSDAERANVEAEDGQSRVRLRES
ncbi:MAG: hypothetical protein ACPG43_04355 [Alcanivoracaceae bacterium]